MVQMMRGVVDGGTGSRLRFRYGLSGAIAGKTGTTNDNSDGWFIGYTPTITAGVWVGAERGKLLPQEIGIRGPGRPYRRCRRRRSIHARRKCPSPPGPSPLP